ncbi:MAG: hypothetical protein ABIP97_04420 [Chthoniobacterales bacterium]
MKTPTNRIELGGQGMGEVSQKEIECRALELARSDGREAFNEKDILQAREEITGQFASTHAPEETTSTLELKEWDTPPGSSGFQHPKTQIREEGTIAEDLVNEGLDEADHNTRAQSGDPQE